MAPIAIESSLEPILPITSTKSITQNDILATSSVQTETKLLPVTLLSGFLGAGKTTLLERILLSNHGYKIGVIVNDMGELNIDATLLKNHKVQKSQESLIEMQNGCICCTLRGDLLEEVSKLVNEGNIDYLLIESSGISEPMQVAETFSKEFAEIHIQTGLDLEKEIVEDEESKNRNQNLAQILKQGGLSKISRLDCCITMIDGVNFFNDFETCDFLIDRHGKDYVPKEDDRNVSDLQIDQIEFANIIIINKCDLISKFEINKIHSLIKILNPEAKILKSIKSNVEIDQLLNTHWFDYEKVTLGAGWLKSLREEIKPETEEYGIGSFVFRSRRPFHPERLWETIKNNFVVIQEEYIDDGLDEDEDEKMDEDHDLTQNDTMEIDDELQPQLNPKARLAAKKANPTFSHLLRSKGFIWLATRPFMFGEWSQAGVMLTLTGGDKWRCELNEDEWPENEEIRKEIRKDFKGKWGDRRQEIVLIGQEMQKGGRNRLQNALDACLLNDNEWQKWENIMKNNSWNDEKKKEELEKIFEDGFEDWVLEENEDHDHSNHKH